MAEQPAVCVVPVREQEAWLLVDESAIRRAAWNPHGRVRLALPKVKALEGVADPKALLRSALETASEKTGRHLRRFSVEEAADRVTAFIEDFASLEELPAFCDMLAEVDGALFQILGDELTSAA
jgi:hypothetical protein